MGFKYHELEPMHRNRADIFIDDKGVNVDDWIKAQPQKKVLLLVLLMLFILDMFGCFRMQNHCNHLTVALHVDPSTERSHKLSPVQTFDERMEILFGMNHIDDVVLYKNEEGIYLILRVILYDCRFIGTDYREGNYTGKDIDIEIVWLDRETHNYSSTRLKDQIYESIRMKKWKRRYMKNDWI